MKIILYLSTFLFVLPTQAKITFNTTATSDYIWRGVTQTSHHSTIQGGMEYAEPKTQLTTGVWISGVDNGSETDLYLKYPIQLAEQYNVTVGGTFYYYANSTTANTGEGNLNFVSPYALASINYTSDYFGTNTSSFYFEVTKIFVVKDGISLIPTVGYVTFDDKDKSQNKNYFNYRIEIVKDIEGFTFKIFHTSTNRKIYISGVQDDVHDQVIGVALSKNL